MRKLMMVVAVAATTFAAAPAFAAPITSNPVLVVGNITFDNFSCSSTPTALPCNQIEVIVDPNPPAGELGIRFQGAFNSTVPGQFNNTIIEYDAHISGALFTDASLFYNGTPISSVFEQIFDANTNNVIGTLFVQNPPPVFTDHTDLSNAVTDIHVAKGIQYITPDDGQATISIIDQTYSQAQAIPEPASLALLGGGLLTMGYFIRRRRHDA